MSGDAARGLGPPDLAVTVLAGSYLVPAVAATVAILGRRAAVDAGPLALGVLAASAIAFVVGTLLARRVRDLGVRLGRTPRTWLLVLVPLVGPAAVAVTLFARGWATLDGTEIGVLLAGAGTAFLGLSLAVTASNRHAARVLEDATEEVSWSAPWPARRRRRLRLAAGTVIGLGGVAFVVGSILESSEGLVLGQLAVAGGIGTLVVGREATYRATDLGLEIRASAVSRRVYPWSGFEGYRHTDEELVLSRAAPWGTAIRCDLAAIEDPDSVISVLDTHLDRLA